MKLKIAALAAAVMMSFSVFTACSESSDSSNNASAVSESQQQFEKDYKNVPKIEDGPKLYVKDTTASPGEIAEVTLAVSNADMKWNMCGIHLTFPNVLDCINISDDVKDAEYITGDACRQASAHIAMEWQKNLTEELERKRLGSVFFTATFNGNKGMDGDIATFYFKIPENAKSGATYDIGFYYSSTDIFSNEENNLSFQRYAFENWEGGTITVK